MYFGPWKLMLTGVNYDQAHMRIWLKTALNTFKAC